MFTTILFCCLCHLTPLTGAVHLYPAASSFLVGSSPFLTVRQASEVKYSRKKLKRPNKYVKSPAFLHQACAFLVQKPAKKLLFFTKKVKLIPWVLPMAIEEFDPYPKSGFSHGWRFDQDMKKGALSETEHLFYKIQPFINEAF